jgi:hypothetical protein
MGRSVLILALVLAVPLWICQAQADQGPLERTGRTIKHGAQAAGRTIKRETGAPEAASDTVDIAPCLLSCPSKEGFVAGHAAKNLDGYMFLMLDVPDPVAKVFVQGQMVGRTQERERIRRLLRDALSPQLLVALFAVAGAEAKAEEEGHEEAKQLARAMKALEEAIENIVKALEKPG